MSAPLHPIPSELVVDTSVVVAWAFKEQGRVASAESIINQVQAGSGRAYVPELLWAEFQQAAERKLHANWVARDRLGLSQPHVESAYQSMLQLSVGWLMMLPALAEPAVRDEAWQLRLALGIESYDAHFVALALLYDVELWTFDQRVCSLASADARVRHSIKLVGVDV